MRALIAGRDVSSLVTQLNDAGFVFALRTCEPDAHEDPNRTGQRDFRVEVQDYRGRLAVAVEPDPVQALQRAHEAIMVLTAAAVWGEDMPPPDWDDR